MSHYSVLVTVEKEAWQEVQALVNQDLHLVYKTFWKDWIHTYRKREDAITWDYSERAKEFKHVYPTSSWKEAAAKLMTCLSVDLRETYEESVLIPLMSLLLSGHSWADASKLASVIACASRYLNPYGEVYGDPEHPYTQPISRQEVIIKEASQLIAECSDWVWKEHPYLEAVRGERETVGDLLYQAAQKFGLDAPPMSLVREFRSHLTLNTVSPEDLVALCWSNYSWLPTLGCYGVYDNPNGAWDYWIVGGRWGTSLISETLVYDAQYCNIEQQTGYLLKGQEQGEDGFARGSILQRKDLSLEGIHHTTLKARDQFWEIYQAWLADEEVNPWDSPVHYLKLMGFKVQNEDQIKAFRKAGMGCKPEFERELSYEELCEDYLWAFSPTQFAACGKEGMKAPDRPYWFDFIENPPTVEAWTRDYVETFYKSGDPEDYLLVVDCHT